VAIFKIIHFNGQAATEVIDVAAKVLNRENQNNIDSTDKLRYCGAHTVKGSSEYTR